MIKGGLRDVKNIEKNFEKLSIKRGDLQFAAFTKVLKGRKKTISLAFFMALGGHSKEIAHYTGYFDPLPYRCERTGARC